MLQQSKRYEGFGYVVAGLLFAVMLLVEGCATDSSAPYTQFTLTQTAIADAEQAGANQYASAELQMAKDKLDNAKTAMNERKYQRAKFLAEEAEVDAKVAEHSSRSFKADRAAQEVRSGVQTLQNELQRQPSQ